MKKKERKSLELNLIIALKEVLANNKSVPTKKSEKDIQKSMMKISKLKFKKTKSVSNQKSENDALIKKVV